MTTATRIAITGGSGFIGTRLTRALVARGIEVVCVDVKPPSDPISWIDADIRDEDSLTDAFTSVDGVFHLAAAVGVDECLGDDDRVISINTDGTRAVLAACRRAGVARLVFSSSSEVYGDGVSESFHEDDHLHPKSTYGASKVASEQLLRAAADDGLAVRVVRLFNVYGPGQREDFVIPRFVRQAVEGKEITVYGDGQQIRCYTHVDDAIEGFVRAFDDAADGLAFQVYNIGRPVHYSVLQLVDVVLEAARSVSTVKMLSLGTDTVRSPEIEVFRRRPDVSRALHQLDFVARMDIVDGVSEMVDAVRSEAGATIHVESAALV